MNYCPDQPDPPEAKVLGYCSCGEIYKIPHIDEEEQLRTATCECNALACEDCRHECVCGWEGCEQCMTETDNGWLCEDCRKE